MAATGDAEEATGEKPPGADYLVGLTAAVVRRPATLVALLLLAAWCLVAAADRYDNGTYTPGAMQLVALGGLLALVAVPLLARSDAPAEVALVVLVVPLVECVHYAFHDVPLRFVGVGHDLDLVRHGTEVAALLALLVLLPWRTPQSAWWLVLLVTAVVGAVVIVASPRPDIDVWALTNQAVDATIHGHSLYSTCWRFDHDPRTECVYPYLPGTMLLQAPFRLLFGDVRYGLVAALCVAAFAVNRVAAPAVSAGLAVLVLVMPHVPYALEEGWTEPLLMAELGLLVLAVRSGHTRWAVVAFGAALATKQHMLLLLPLAFCWPQFGRRRTLVSVAAAAVVMAPWALLDRKGFLNDALWFNLRLPARADSLSLFTTATRAGWTPHFAIVGGLTLLAMAVAVFVLPRTTTGFAAGAALVLLVFTILNKQSFFNEWWLVLFLFVLAVAAATSEPRRRPVPPPAQ